VCGVAGCASMGSDARTQEGGREAAAAAASAAAVSACQLAAAVAAVESAVGSVGVPGRGGRCRPPLVAADRVFLPQASLGSRVKGGARPSANCVSPFRSVQHDGQSMSMDVVIRDLIGVMFIGASSPRLLSPRTLFLPQTFLGGQTKGAWAVRGPLRTACPSLAPARWALDVNGCRHP